MNLSDMLLTPRNAQQLAQQFGISQAQAQEAMAALIPAFSEGLKRNVSTGQQAAGFIQALATGQHARYIENPAEATAAPGIAEGNAILSHLFGGKQVSRGVAQHAAASSGLGAGLLKQMLPVIASMVMGALFKGATGGNGGGIGGALGRAAGGGLLGTLIEGVAGGFLQGGKQAMPRTRRRSPRAGADPLGDLLGGLLGGGGNTRAASRTRQRQRAPQPQQGGLEGLLDSLLGGGGATTPARRQRPRIDRDPVMPPPRGRASRPRIQRRPRGSDGLGNIFGEMLEPGASSSRDYQRKTRSVIDDLLGN